MEDKSSEPEFWEYQFKDARENNTMRYMEKIKDKGVAIGERNIIEKMFENGFSISEITKITGKSADDIESLMNMNTEIDFDYEWAAWQNEVRLRMWDEEKIREGYREGLKRSLKDVIERWQNSGESRTELKDMMGESFELSEREAEEILAELWR